MNEINNLNNVVKADEKLVSTKELAEILGVDISTVKKTVKRLEEGGDVLHYSTTVKGNTFFYYTEKQATLIKQEIQKHHNLASRQIDSVSTEYEENQTIANAMMILQRRNDELLKRVEQAESENAILMHTKDTYTFTEIAKELGMKSKGFGEWLHSKGYVYFQNGAWIPYSGYEDFFITKQSTNDAGMSFYYSHITQKGRLYFLKKYGDKNNLSKTDVLRLRKNLQDELYMQNAIEDAAGKIAGEIA